MSTHPSTLRIAALPTAPCLDERFAFGTGKLGDLAAFASAIILALITLLIG